MDLTSGAIDTTFSPAGANANGFDYTVNALAVSGTSLYVGGSFNAYKGVAASASGLAKLDLTTGAIDTTFSPVGANANGFGYSVNTLSISGTSLFAGGSFTRYRGTSRAYYFAPVALSDGALGD